MLKKILSVILTIALCFTVLPLQAVGESVSYTANTGGVFTFDKSSRTITAYDSKDAISTDLIIPAQIDGVDVEVLGANLFYFKNITSVTIPSTLTHIGDYAFELCGSLSSVNFAENSALTALGTSAFFNCISLKEMDIPSTVTDIGESAFSRSGLRSIAIPDAVKSLEYVFSNCGSLTEVTFGENSMLEVVGVDAFLECTSLESISLPAALTHIGKNAFIYNTSLQSIHIPAGVEAIGENAFKQCQSLSEVTFDPDGSLLSIGKFAFNGCPLAGDIALPAGVTEIGLDAFTGCSLTSVNIPAGVKILNSTFYNCKSLSTVTFDEGCTLTTISGAFNRCESLSEILLPDSLTVIGAYTFTNSGLESLIIPNTVTTVGEGAFYNCTGLQAVTLPDNTGYLKIENETFKDCSALEGIWLPDRIKTIGADAFAGCGILSDINLPEGLERIESGAFKGCGIETLHVPASCAEIGEGALAGNDNADIYIYNRDIVLDNDPFSDGVAVTSGVTVHGHSTKTDKISESDIKAKAQLYGYTFQELEETAGLSVILKAPDGSVINGGYSVRWTDDGGNTVTSGIVGKDYEYGITLGEELAFIYKAPEDGGLQSVGQGMNTAEVTLSDLEEVALSGTVLPAAASLTITQSAAGHSRITDLVSDASGNYSKVIKRLDTLVTASHSGYYDARLYKSAAALGDSWDMGEIILSELPAGDIMRVSVEKSAGGTSSGITKLQGLTFRLEKEEGDGYAELQPEKYAIQYPYIIVKDASVGNHTKLRLSVTAEAGLNLAGGSNISTKSNGRFDVTLKEYGRFKAVLSGAATGNKMVMTFDDEGYLAGSGRISSGNTVYISDPLKAGSHTVVLMAENSLFTGVSSLSALTGMGFAEGTDYLKRTVTIEDDAIDEINGLSIPELDVSGNRTTLLDANFSDVKAANKNIAVLRPFLVSVNYRLKQATEEDKVITINLPDGAVLTAHSNSMGAAVVPALNKVTCQTAKSEGSIYLYMYLSKTGMNSVSASLAASGKTVPLGSFSINAEDISLTMDDIQTDGGNIRAEIRTAPGVAVKLYLDGTPVQLKSGGGWSGTVTANALGRADLVFSLPESAGAGSKHYVTAEVTTLEDKVIRTITPGIFTYFPSATVKTLKFIHGGKTYTIDYEDNQNSSKYYTYLALDNAKYWNWTFYADIEGYRMLDKSGTLLKITMLDGSFRILPLSYLEDANDPADNICTFAGSIVIQPAGDHVFKSSLIPCEFAISYGLADAPPLTLNHAILWNDVKTIYDDRLADWEVTAGDINDRVEAILAQIENEPDTDISLYGDPLDSYTYQYEKLSETDSFLLMPDEIKAKILNVEAAEEEFFEFLSKILGIGDIRSYEDQDALYRDIGIEYEELQDFSPQLGAELIQGGYQYCEYSDAGGSGIYLRYDADKLGYTLYSSKPDQMFRLSVRFPDYALQYYEDIQQAYPVEELNPMKIAGFGLFGAPQETPWWRRPIPGNTDIFGYIVEGFGIRADKIAKTSYEATRELLKMATCADGVTYTVGQQNAARFICDLLNGKSIRYENIGKGLSLVSFALNYNELLTLDDLAEELKGRRIKLQDMFERLDFTEQDGIDCMDAIIEEQKAIHDFQTLLNDKRFYTQMKALLDCGIAVGDLFSYGACSGAKIALLGNNIAWDSSFAYKVAQAAERLNHTRAKVEKDCGDDKKWNRRKNIEPILDPSGYVYEAVASNRLEGVTATVYKQGEGAAWDAADYDQQNPLATDSNGRYAWDVPVGSWQVKYEKPGYLTRTTGWLPVPPPQMDVNIALISAAPPAVSSIHAYEDYIEVIFSQYMDIASFGGLTADGGGVGLTLAFPDKEVSPSEPNTYYAKTLRISKAGAGFAGTAAVSITGARNYAGTVLADYSSGALPIEPRPAQLLFNYETLVLETGATSNVTVRVQDSSGEFMSGVELCAVSEIPSLAAVSATATTDAQGRAVFTAAGILPGATVFEVRANETSLCGTVNVSVVTGAERPARPAAALGLTVLGASAPQENNVTVAAGTKLVLTCSTKGAKIYYTTNNTCPCQAGLGRVEYTGPVTVNENTYFRIASYKNGMRYSERLNIAVTVSSGGSGGSPGGDSSSGGDASDAQKDDTLPDSEASGDDAHGGLAAQFTDIPVNAWYYDDVEFVLKKGLFRGTSASTFSPNAPMTRAMLVTVLYRLEGEPSGNVNSFIDVPGNAWYTDAVAWASANNIVNGVGNNRFEPERDVTREEIATILYRYAMHKKHGVSMHNDLSGYADSGRISKWAIAAMRWANAEAIITGRTKTTLVPGGKALRAEVAAIIRRFLTREPL